jgi:hypothetical protein
MNKWQRNSLTALIVVLMIIAGYLRDFFAINLNYLLFYKQGGTETWEGHSFFNVLLSYSAGQLYAGKYLLTGVFTVLNFFLGALLLRVLFNQKSLLKLYFTVYITVLAVAVLFFAAGYLAFTADAGYSYARTLLGFLQSPLPAGILAVSYPLYLKSKSQKVEQ